MKSAPFSMKARTGGGAPPARRLLMTRSQLPLVRSGFCSEPESANSRSMIFWLSTNQE